MEPEEMGGGGGGGGGREEERRDCLTRMRTRSFFLSLSSSFLTREEDNLSTFAFFLSPEENQPTTPFPFPSYLRQKKSQRMSVEGEGGQKMQIVKRREKKVEHCCKSETVS